MATAISTTLDSIDVYQFLKIYQMNGFTRNLSEASEMWGYLKQLKEMDAAARSVKFLLIDELGYGAVQAMSADGSGAYPTAQRSNLQEPEAKYKEWAWTVDVPRVLEGKTGSELMQYAKPLATELDNKQIAFARLKCIELQGDGTGAIGRVSGTPTVTATDDATADKVVVTLYNTSAEAGRSCFRWFQEGDKVKFYAADGTSHGTIDNGNDTVAYWKVADIDEANVQVTLHPYNSSDARIAVASATNSGTEPTADDYIYRFGTTPNSATIASIANTVDYAALSEVMAGLESLTANDGRLLHGVNMTGAIKGTRKDLNAAVLDSKHFQQLLSELKRKGGKRYTYDAAFMSDDTYDSLVESRETDRRFHSLQDTDRGVKGIGYVHGRDRVEFVPDEFVHDQRIWVLPKGKDALCYIGKDAEQVKPNGNDPFHLSISGSNYGRNMQTFFEQTGVLISKHPRALGVIEDFTVSS